MKTRNQILLDAKKIFFLFLLTLVLEGAVRKWVMPSATNILLAFRDICAIALIALAIRHRSFAKLGILIEVALVWSSAVIFWGMIQLLFLETYPVVFFIGLRFWLLYFWMALAVGSILSTQDLQYIYSRLGGLLVLMTPLVLAQHLSPPGHFINIQPDTEEDKVFRVAGDVVRASGTFSFTLGFTCFLALVSPAIFQPNDFPGKCAQSVLKSFVTSLCLFVSTIVSGSRAAILLYLMLFALNTILQFFKNSKIEESIAAGAKIIASLSLMVVLLTGLSGATDATITRFQEASEAEVLSDRVMTIFAGEPEVRAAFTAFGLGIGAGTNAGGVLSTGQRTFQLAESEPGRISLEAGLLGYAYTGLKITIVLAGVGMSLMILMQNGSVLPMLMWIVTGVGLLTWPISGQLSAHGFGFAMLGLSLALVFQPEYYMTKAR